MELWLDTINFDLIENTAQQINLAGVTTNPSILSQASGSPDKTIERLLSIQPGRVAVQVTAVDAQGMIDQAKRISQTSERIIIKVPVTNTGLHVIKQLAADNIPAMATAVFESSQVYLSMLAGAKYVAPYFGRISEVSAEPLAEIDTMLHIIDTYNSDLKLIAAAITTKQEIIDCLSLGAHAITLPDLAFQLLSSDHPNTTLSLAGFQQDWAARDPSELGQLF